MVPPHWNRLCSLSLGCKNFQLCQVKSPFSHAGIKDLFTDMDGSSGSHINPKPVLKACPAPTGVFTGRQDVLSKMHAYFSSDLGMRHIFVLYGLGGAGKSQIAYKFVDMWKRDCETNQCVMSIHSIGACHSYFTCPDFQI